LRFIFIILFIFSAELSSAQDLITLANTYLNNEKYAEAKQAIDDAFQNNEVIDNPRAWYTKARVYHEILKSEDPAFDAYKADYEDFVNQVIGAYQKTQSLTESTNNLHVLAFNQIEILWASGINTGVASYQKNKFEEALLSFKVAIASKPADTLAYLYAGLSAQNAGLYAEAIEKYLALRPYARLSTEAYNGVIVSSQAMGAPYEDQLGYVREARIEYPNHFPYVIQEVRILVRLNRFSEAEEILDQAFIDYPNNPILIIRQADLYDRIFKAAYINNEPDRSEHYFVKAENKYQEYLTIYPDDFTANYNYSVMLNEQANRRYAQIKLMSKEDYLENGKKIEKEGHDWTRKALPYMEKAYEVNAEEEKVVVALMVYYERLGLNDKLKALNEKY